MLKSVILKGGNVEYTGILTDVHATIYVFKIKFTSEL